MKRWQKILIIILFLYLATRTIYTIFSNPIYSIIGAVTFIGVFGTSYMLVKKQIIKSIFYIWMILGFPYILFMWYCSLAFYSFTICHDLRTQMLILIYGNGLAGMSVVVISRLDRELEWFSRNC